MKFLTARTAFLVLVLATLMGLPFQSRAAYEIFLNFSGVGTNIPISSLQWGESRAIGSPTGGGGGRETSPPSFSEVTISKMMDSASPQLAMLAANGDGNATCVITIKHATSGIALYTLTLEKVFISSYSVSSGGDVPAESLSLNFTKIIWVYQKLDSTGKAVGKASDPLGWDLAKQEPIP
ncbi:MAG TPA: type VI secretion system tube protein Hcp [Verrucomicrobiae bacterium]|nr:type VI secretion system tube protein Hcp [Verrucomicrobiae bacterium]